MVTISVTQLYQLSQEKYYHPTYTDIQIVMMVSLVKGLAASLHAVVHSVWLELNFVEKVLEIRCHGNVS